MLSSLAGFFRADTRTGPFWPTIFTLGAAVMGLCALVHRHLYADGAPFLLEILQKQTFTHFDPPRQFAHYVLQAPLVVAFKLLGITDLRILSWVFGLTLFLTPVLSLWICWRILRRRNRSLMILPALTWAGLTLTTSFFIISESWLGVALFWPLYFLLYYRRHRLGTKESLFLLGGSLVATRVYEGFLILAALLFLLALRRLRGQGPGRLEGWSVASALCLGASFVLGVWWAMHPRDPGNRLLLLDGIRKLTTYRGAFLLLAAVPLLAGPRWFRGPAARVLGRALGVLLVAAAIAWAWTPWTAPLHIAAHDQADLRLLNNLLPFGLGLLPFLAARWPSFRPTFNGGRRLVFAGFTLAVLAWQVGSCWVWTRYTGQFGRILAEQKGVVLDQRADLRRFGFDCLWTQPIMSLALRGIQGRPVQAVVLNPVWTRWQPFDPRVPAALPHLERYLRYGPELMPPGLAPGLPVAK